MKGYMKMKLTGAETLEDFMRQTEFTEDWAITRKRVQLYKKPRLFTVNIYLVNNQGQRALNAITLKTKATKQDLANVIYEEAVAMVKENLDAGIDLQQSYAVVRAWAEIS